MGYALSWILIYVINKQSFGWTISFHTPVALILASLAVTLLSSALAGLALLLARLTVPRLAIAQAAVENHSRPTRVHEGLERL